MPIVDVNAEGLRTLTLKEVKRFWSVLGQTVTAPVVTALLYLLVFGQVMQDRVEVYPGVGYLQFLVPGLIMMSVIQNAFANSSSSLIQSKLLGNLVFLLMAPISAWEIFAAYLAAALFRAGLVGLVLYTATWPFAHLPLNSPLVLLGMFLLSGASLAVVGLIAGIVSAKFDHLASFQNFLILPASFLSGVFYSIHSLPPVWQALSHVNPFFYLIDGFRYGFFGLSDVSPVTSLAVLAVSLAIVSSGALWMVRAGYKLRH